MQVVTFPVKKSERILNQARQVGVAQVAVTCSLIEVSFQLSTPLGVIFNFPEMFPLGAKQMRKRIE